MFIKKVTWLVKNIFLLPVHFYRLVISPWTRSSCIYAPTCSKYMIEAVHGHGIIKGGILGLTRIGRCHGTFFIGGDDPVPGKFIWKDISKNYKKFHLHKHKKDKS